MIQQVVAKYFQYYFKVTDCLVLRRIFWIILIGDTGLIILAHFIAYIIRFDGNIVKYSSIIVNWLPVLILIKLPVFYFFGLYRGMWRYTSIADLINIFRSVSISSGIVILFDAGEENLYNIQMKFQHEHKFLNSVSVLGKIQNRDLLNSIFLEYAPAVVFHAAAYKQSLSLKQTHGRLSSIMFLP